MSTPRPLEPGEEDIALQGAILCHVLDEHPALLRRSDLIREITTDEEGWAHEDKIGRAIAELAQRALLDYLGDYVLPTRAAVHFRSLGVM